MATFLTHVWDFISILLLLQSEIHTSTKNPLRGLPQRPIEILSE